MQRSPRNTFRAYFAGTKTCRDVFFLAFPPPTSHPRMRARRKITSGSRDYPSGTFATSSNDATTYIVVVGPNPPSGSHTCTGCNAHARNYERLATPEWSRTPANLLECVDLVPQLLPPNRAAFLCVKTCG